RLHDRDQLAGDEGEGDEGGREDEARGGEDDPPVVRPQPRAEVALQAEDQHEDETGHDRRDREREVDERREQRPARKAEAGDRPGGGDPEDQVGGDRERRDRERQANRGQRVLVGREGVPVGPEAARERLDEDFDERYHDQDPDHAERRRDERD